MNFITVGKIVKPRGLKGEVKVKLFTNYPSALKNIKTFYVGSNKTEKKVKTVSIRDGFAYILLEDVDSIEKAELLRNFVVYALKEDFEIKDNSTFLISDIIGLYCYDENDNYLGELIEIEQYGAADVWNIRGAGRTYSFPYISKIVKEVDLKNSKIILDKKSFDEAKI